MIDKKDKTSLSLPKARKVCGYDIMKMPIAPYLTAIEKLKELPADFVSSCFPGKASSEILESLTTIDKNGLTELFAGVFIAAPKYIIDLVSDLTGIDREALLTDENIGIDGIIEIIDAFIEVNRLGKCIHGVLELKAKMTGLVKPI